MNTRSAGRELAFLAISQLSYSSELAPEKLILAATRTLKDIAKEQIKKVQKDLQVLGEFFFNESLNKQEEAEYKIDLDKLHKQIAQLELASFTILEALDLPELLNQPSNAFEHAIALISSYRANKEKINNSIAKVLEEKKNNLSSKGWSFERILSVERDILRIAGAECLSSGNVPPVVIVIDEALKLAEKYGTDDSPKFVNGVLSDLLSEFQ